MEKKKIIMLASLGLLGSLTITTFGVSISNAVKINNELNKPKTVEHIRDKIKRYVSPHFGKYHIVRIYNYKTKEWDVIDEDNMDKLLQNRNYLNYLENFNFIHIKVSAYERYVDLTDGTMYNELGYPEGV